MTSTPRILVPVDVGQDAASLVKKAWELAQEQGAEIHFLHVIPVSANGLGSVLSRQNDTLRMLEEVTGLPRSEGNRTIAFQHAVRFGQPGRAIAEYARELAASSILLGSRCRSRLSHFVLGSVSEDVVRQSHCPVTIVPLTDSGDGEASTLGGHSSTSASDEAPEQAPQIRSEGHDGNRITDLLQRALDWRATDIHIDPVDNDQVVIRFRVDGKLKQFCKVTSSLAAPLLMQLKLMADFETTQLFEPREGRLNLPESLGTIEGRVTVAPVCGGEAVAIRLLKHNAEPRALSTLGMTVSTYESIQEMLRLREGLILVTGPTGSGKTTTVYAMLQALGYHDRNVVSIEDPVEYRVAGIRQLSVSERHGLTLARGLKSLLRMDPDVVFIGEIRDAEALEIAMRASSSGRYVLTTLHTRDVASTVTALRDLHADSYSLSANLSGIVSQRLIRCLCHHCRTPSPTTDDERNIFDQYGLECPGELFKPQGCQHCLSTGYRERIGVFEAVVANNEIAVALQQNTSEEELRQLVRATRTKGLIYDALVKAREGITSMSEALSLGRG